MKVFIVGADSLTERMFLSRNWDVVDTLANADLVCFLGGEDVTPSLYDETNLASHCNWMRDVEEMTIWDEIRELNLPTVGICRGGQFLNVMNGGKMYQDVDGHCYGNHDVIVAGISYNCTSTHHQMMIPSDKGLVIGVADETKDILCNDGILRESDTDDTEIVWYPENRSLCFQPHPEYNGKKDQTEGLFFDLIKQYIGLAA